MSTRLLVTAARPAETAAETINSNSAVPAASQYETPSRSVTAATLCGGSIPKNDRRARYRCMAASSTRPLMDPIAPLVTETAIRRS